MKKQLLAALPLIAWADLSIDKSPQGVLLKKVEDHRNDAEPSIKVYWERLTVASTGDSYAYLDYGDADDKTIDLLKESCISRDWHMWIGTSDDIDIEPNEWWQTTCKIATPPNEKSPYPGTSSFRGLIYSLPLGLLNTGYDLKNIVVRTDTVPYEDGRNKVCQAGYHFFTQIYASVKEGSPPEEDDGIHRRPVQEISVPAEVRALFENEVDPCAFIVHPCWCDRAPTAWKCRSCQMTEQFGNRWLCYGEDFDENAAWCDAISVERIKGEPNRPINTTEYAQLLKARENDALALDGRDIHWLSV